MSKTNIPVFLAFVLLLAGATCAKDADKEQAIRERVNEFTAAWNKHDAPALAAMWTKDGDLIDSAGRVARGQEQVRQMLEEKHATTMKDSTFSLLSIEKIRFLKSDIAVVDWRDVISGMRAQKGELLLPQKQMVTVVMALKQGKWMFAAIRAGAFEQVPTAPEKQG